VDSLKEGATVSVTLDKSIYSTGPFTAQNIFVHNFKKQVASIDVLNGTIVKVDGNIIIVETQVVDSEAFEKVDITKSFTVPYISKLYTITINDNTEFMDSGYDFVGNGLIPGFQVHVWGDGDLYGLDSFTATKILITPFK
jgi:hypothetical protein